MNPAANAFYDQPILNSPYEHPTRHWELDGDNRPTNRVTDSRRPSSYVSPIPKPRKTGGKQLARIMREGVDSGRDTRASVWYKRSVYKRLATTEAPA